MIPDAQPAPSTTVPLLDLKQQYEPLRDELLQALTRVADSQRFILGPETDAFEREIAASLGVSHAVGVSSGTDAILAALMALQIGPGDEVITSTYSFFATAGCIVRLGARPVLVDIDPITFNLGAERVAALVTERTRAIVPVHLFGLAADMGPLLELSHARGIPLIEDACQAIGAGYRGAAVGGLGTMGCFSFFPSKNLGGFGDGGLVTTNDPELARRLRMLRHHGQDGTYQHAMVGGNFRLDEMQAAVLRIKLPHLSRWAEGRRQNARRYKELFAAAALTGRVSLPEEPLGFFHVFNQFVIRVPARDGLRTHLQARGIGTSVYYPVPFHLQRCFENLGYQPGDFPTAEAAAADSLALPIFPELTSDQQAYVVECIAEHLSR